MKNVIKAVFDFVLRCLFAALGFAALGFGCWGLFKGLAYIFEKGEQILRTIWNAPQFWLYLAVAAIFAAIMHPVCNWLKSWFEARKAKKSSSEE